MSTEIAPPAYHEIFKQLVNFDTKKSIGASRVDIKPIRVETPADVSDAKISPEDGAKIALGIAKAIQTDDGKEAMKKGALAAAQAVKDSATNFSTLLVTLSSIDSRNMPPPEGPFAPRMQALQKAFNATVAMSKDLAVRIAVYGEDFDQVMLPLSQDPTITIDQRRKKLQEFIAEAKEFETATQSIEDAFQAFLSDFEIFRGTFNHWAESQEGDLKVDLKNALDDLKSLNDQLTKVKIALTAFEGAAAAALPVTGVVAALAGPEAAPFIILAGCIFAAVSVGIVTGLEIDYKSLSSDISAKQSQIDDLTAQIADIDAARLNLEKEGDQSLADFKTQVGAINQMWQCANGDAVEIDGWLAKGANFVDMPSYMRIQTDHAVSTYETLAGYLRVYADGI